MSDLQALLSEALVAHREHEFAQKPDGELGWSDNCMCGFELFGSENSPEHRMHPGVSYAAAAFADHQANVVAALVRKAISGTLLEAVSALESELLGAPEMTAEQVVDTLRKRAAPPPQEAP